MKKLRFPVLIIGAALITLAALCLGPIHLSVGEVLTYSLDLITGNPSHNVHSDLVQYLLLPHMVLAFFVGGGLAVTGAVMQAIMKNPLADPYLLGVSSGAGLGAVLAISLGIGTLEGLSGVGVCAFLGAGLISALILIFSAFSGKSGSLSLILIGFALNALCSAVVNFIVQAMADPSKTRSVQFWLMGNISVDDWFSIMGLGVIILLGTFYFMTQSRILDLMLIGDDISLSMGRNLAVYRKIYIAVTAIMTGATVYMTGMIGFVGLLIPHMVRLVIGAGHRRLISASFFTGGCFLVCADLAGRYVIPGMELPIGVTAAVCGAPFFVWMLLSGKYVKR